MEAINFPNIPASLSELNNWLLWKIIVKNGQPTKVPFQTDGEFAKTNDPETWSTFENVKSSFGSDYAGIGFVFSKNDPFCGIDLDGCRDPETGKVEEWARKIILRLESYSEVSPSLTGIKIFVRGKWDHTVHKAEFKQFTHPTKTPAIEIYDHLRYFAVTGKRLAGVPFEPQDRQEQLDQLKAEFWPDAVGGKSQMDWYSDSAVVERARKYVDKMPSSISGQSGHDHTYSVACRLVIDFQLGQADAMGVLQEYNQRCQPPWSEKELQHKIDSARKANGPRGRLRIAKPDNYHKIPITQYEEPKSEPEQIQAIELTTVIDAAADYLKEIKQNAVQYLSTSIPELDYAIGGGVRLGEMVIWAARPSHGKSALALQSIHSWTEAGIPCLIISEEMSELMLGKRTIQYITPLHEDVWRHESQRVEKAIEEYRDTHAKCFISKPCGTIERAAEVIREGVLNRGVKCVVVDYAQLLQSKDRRDNRNLEVGNTSLTLRKLATELQVVIVALCQLNREVENQPRGERSYSMRHIRDSGQLEQDADIIGFLQWPWKDDPSQQRDRYIISVVKNRNRQIVQPMTYIRFLSDRQMFTEQLPQGFQDNNPRVPSQRNEIPD